MTAPPDPNCNDAKCDQPGGNGNLIVTANGNTQLYGGYHTLFDKTSSQCVKVDPELARGADYTVGNMQSTFELKSVTSREELAHELGLDLGLKVKYLGTNANGALSMMRKLKRDNRTANLVLKVKSAYTVRNRQQLMLTDSAQARLEEGPDRFVSACGTHYVNGVQYAAEVYLLITYTAQDDQTALDLKASLQLSGSVGLAEVDADVKARLANSSNIAGVSTTIHVAAQGFGFGDDDSTSELIADLLGGAVTDETFLKLDDIRHALESSITIDACRDAGEGQCGDIEAPGYFDNVRKLAVPAAVDIGFYDSLANVPAEQAADFVLIKERLTKIERFIRDWAELEERMEDVYWSEMAPFLTADVDAKASYQVAPPGQPLRRPEDLVNTFDHYLEMFLPEKGSQIGSKFEIASNKIRDCWNRTSVDVMHECAPGDIAAADSPAWQEIEGDLRAYDEEARILPLRYQLAHDVRYGDIRDACSALNTAGITYRPPTLEEARLLAPAMGYGTIDWTAEEHQSWIETDDPASLCPNQDDTNPSYRNSPAFDEGEIVCMHKDDLFSGITLNTMCVPSGGPMPLRSLP